MAYYLYDGTKSIGPFGVDDLLKRPGFGAATLVFPIGATGADAWKPAGGVPEIAAALKTAGSRAVDEFAAPRPAAPSEKLVLVVDDDDSVRSFIETCATMQGFHVITAVNGLDATEKLAARPPDLIVTDLMMPGQSGYEFLRSLQAAGNGRIPVFVVTGSILDASTVALIRQEANVAEFIAKPVNMGQLVAALHLHLRTTRAV